MNPLATRHLKVLDGMRFSFRLLEHHYRGLYPSCVLIPKDNAQVVPALASCWGFIDSLHRLRELTAAAPGLGGKKPEVKRFLAATSLAEDCRHYIQHLRHELAKSQPSPFPVWGSLSWVDQALTHTVIIGTRLPEVQYSGAVFDTHERRWLSKVCLGVENSSFNFDPIFEETKAFEQFVIPWLLAQHVGVLTVSQQFPIINTRMAFKNG